MEKLDKLLLFAASTILVLAVLFLLSAPELTGFAVQDSASQEKIKIATFAVCEEKENYTFCKDKLYASCNREAIEVVNGTFDCNGKIYNASELNLGEAYHPKNWTDPRQENSITAWASAA